MPFAGTFAAFYIFKLLLFWACASAASFWLFTRLHRWLAIRKNQPYDYLASPALASIKLATFQIFWSLVLLFALIALSGKLHLTKGDAGVLASVALYTYVCVLIFLGQWQIGKLIPVSGFWSARLLWLPLGIFIQLAVLSSYFGFHYVYKTTNPEQYEQEGSIYPSAQMSPSPHLVQIRPSKVTLTIPSNHIEYIQAIRLPSYQETNTSKFWTRVELVFLLPEFQPKTVKNAEAFLATPSTDLVTVQISATSKGDGYNINKMWKTSGLDRENALNDKRVKQGSLYVGTEPQTGFKEYHLIGMAHRWLLTDDHVIRCQVQTGGGTVLQPCETTYEFPNNITLTYAFPYARRSEWRAIDDFVKATYASYPQR